MKTFLRGLALCLILPLCCTSWFSSVVLGADGARTSSNEAAGKKPGNQPAAQMKADDVLLSTMQRELKRATADLGHLDPAPYFISYSVYDQEGTVVVAGLGSLHGCCGNSLMRNTGRRPRAT